MVLWPKQTRGVILGSFYWGYALTQIAASVIVNYLGAKRFLALLIFTSSAATALLPVFSSLHPSFVTLLRVVAGAAQVHEEENLILVLRIELHDHQPFRYV